MKRLILLLSLFILTTPLFAQITITQSDFLALVGSTKTRTTHRSNDQTAVASLIAKSGTGQSWDLSGITFTEEGTTTEQFVAGTSGVPGGDDAAFTSASHHVKSWISTKPDSVSYFFLNLSADAVHAHGASVDSVGNVVKIYYTPPSKIFQLPLSYGVQWTSNYTLTFSIQPGFSIQTTVYYEVDGEGTLTLPQGQTKQVLRLKQTQIQSFGSFSDTSTIYSFIGKSDREAATIIAPKPSPFPPLPGTPGSITYHVGGGGGGGQVTDAPQLIAPANGAIISNTQADLQWGTVTNATSYHVQVSAAADFQTLLQDNTQSGTTITYPLTEGLYYWRVAGVNGQGQAGPWSSVRTFTMTSLDVKTDKQMHISIVPNPANEYVTISNMVGNYQTYELRDALGRTMRTANINASEETMNVDLRSLSPGCYWLVLMNTNGESVTSKIIVK